MLQTDVDIKTQIIEAEKKLLSENKHYSKRGKRKDKKQNILKMEAEVSLWSLLIRSIFQYFVMLSVTLKFELKHYHWVGKRFFCPGRCSAEAQSCDDFELII